MLYSKNILTKLIGYQQFGCLCVRMEFMVGHGTISLTCEMFSLSCSSFHLCGAGTKFARKMVFCFTCLVLWKLHG